MNTELDCRGLACPEPVTRCRSMINETRPDTMTVLVDNPAALENVNRFLTRNGYLTESSKLSDTEWRIHASRSANEQTDSPAENPKMAENGKTLVMMRWEKN